MKKIVIYSESSILGGHEIMTVSLARYLIQLGCNVEFILPYDSERYINYIRDHLGDSCSVNKFEYKNIGYPLFEFTNVFKNNRKGNKLEKELVKISPDLMIVSQGNVEMSLLGVLVAKRLSIPYYSYLAYTDLFRDTGAKFGKARDILNSFIYKYINRFILVDDLYKNDLLVRYSLSDSYVVENKLENLKLVSEKVSINSRGGTKNITLLGRLYTKQKGQDIAIHAMRHLLDTYQDLNINLDIVGTGPDEDMLKELVVKLKLTDYVKFSEWSSDVAKVYEASDVILLPSNYEGFCLVLLESVFLNKIIVASDIAVFKSFLFDEQVFKRGCPVDLSKKLFLNLNVKHSIEYKRMPCLNDERNLNSINNLLMTLK